MTAPCNDGDDQNAVVAFLSNPANYGCGIATVDRLATHASLIFLAGDRAYKVKRAIRYPYLDFSTTERRREACETEVALNRRTAPDLYVGVRGIARAADGRIGWAEHGDVLDWVVVMRRFDQGQLFESLAAAGRLEPSMLRDLVDRVAAFHAGAKVYLDRGGAAAMAAIETSNNETLEALAGPIFEPAGVQQLHTRSQARLAQVSGLLDSRRAAGKVRHCHGDLHLRNVCLLDGKPTLFDCLEFSEELAIIDVLYDVAFLVMDLEHRGLGDLANLAANRYFDMGEDADALMALPLLLSLRAAIRAKVAATAATQSVETSKLSGEARQYLDLALSLLSDQPPRVVALGGLSGAGKSTMARMLAPRLGMRPGARILRSDVIRKRLCGVSPETRLPDAAYHPDMSRRVYEAICDQARRSLRAGYCAIIDAVALREDERRAFAAVAEEAAVPFSGVWLCASPATMTARLASRRGDASDATAEVLRRQLECDPGRIDWATVEIAGDSNSGFAAVCQALGLAGT